MGYSFDVKGRFEAFITEFADRKGQLRYLEKIREMEREGERSLVISYDDLLHQDPKFAEEILLNPEACIIAGEEVLRSFLAQTAPSYIERLKQVHVRIINLADKIHLRSLKTEHLGLLSCFEGIIIGVTEAKPLIIRGYFQCASCGERMVVDFPEGIFNPPYQCLNEHCQKKGSLQLQIEKSVFIDWQKITIQEKPEELPPGQLPQSVTIHVLDDLVDQARPGDRVEVVGILKARASRLLKRGQLATYNKFFHGVSIIKETAEYVDIEINEEEEIQIIDLSKSPYIIEKIRDSLAPSIYGHDLVKEAIASLLFGGSTKETPDGMKLRGETNILLIGDPGVGKSQILKFVAKLAPRALYTTGKGSTAAGLCVAGDSNIFLSNFSTKISNLVKNEFEKGGIEQYTDLMEYKELEPKFRAYHSKNLKIITNPISRVWRIKTPEILYKITSRTGKEIILTPETSLLSINEDGLVWKPAKLLTEGERVATSNKLLFEEKKEIPSIYELISDYPSNMILLNVRDSINDLINRIKKKYSMTNKEITDALGISEDTIYRWKNDKKPENISLKFYNKLCDLAESNIKIELPDEIEIKIKKGQKLILPKELDETWFYILGVLFGDGRVLFDEGEGRQKEICFALSNCEESLLNEFKNFCEKLSLEVSVTKGNDVKPPEYKLQSKLLFHIFSKFGLTASTKADCLKPNPDLFYYPTKYLYSFLRGLYDSNGWIRIHDKGASQIGIVSTSKDLIEFIQYALLSLRIVSFIRIKETQTSMKTSVSKIASKKTQYELTFNSGSEFKIFKQNIGFSHPRKKQILHEYCLREKESHSNLDNIPFARIMLRQIVDFYAYTTRKMTRYKETFSLSQSHKAMSKHQLTVFLEKIQTDWVRHKVKIPYNIRSQFYKDIIRFYGSERLSKITQLSKTQLYEYFVRKNRDSWIPIEIITILLNKKDFNPSIDVEKYFNDLINSVKQEDEILRKKYDLLKNLCNSDILWDEISKIEEIASEDEFVYDLTIPETHNFIVNGFVTHNTAAVIRDQDTGEISLEAGALVLADQGIAMIDEFDKMRPDDRSAIHEAMEQHTISIAKAGIVATLNARTAILAAANPRRGRWNPYKATADNLNLPATILSRFDLIFVLEDKPDLKEDHDKAVHILNLHQSQTLSKEPPIQKDLLRKYIAYARREVHPRLSDEAQERLLEYYKELRRTSGQIEEKGPEPIAITPRQLEALVRLSEARAKMRLSDEVTYDDASGAVNLMNATLEKLAKDTETGKFDIDKYSSDVSAKSRRALDRIDALIDKMLEDAEDEPIAIKDIIDRATEEGLSKAQVVKVIDEMTRRGRLFEPQQGYVKKP